jgi:tetraacyldisaccharide 4'-kinase
VVGTWRYPDHHAFTRAETAEITRRARARARRIVTSEKDAVRMAAFSEDMDRWLALRVDLEITAGRSELEEVLARISHQSRAGNQSRGRRGIGDDQVTTDGEL